MLKIGCLVQNHRTGLGVQQWEFCRAVNPAKVLITDLSKLHAQNSRNQKRVTTTDWFNDYERMTVDGIPTDEQCKWLLEGIDVLFVVETPLNWAIFNYARLMGVKTVLQYNYEFLEYFLRPVPRPDLFLAPSPWYMENVRKFGEVKYLPVPVATDRIKRREITQAKKFVHITGHKAHLDRNGTEIVRQSIRFVNNPSVEIKVHDQSRKECDNYWNLYDEGDVLLLPRRYGGLSLQLQEAAAAGMPVVVTEHDPYAKKDCTITVPGPYDHAELKLRTKIDSYSARPDVLGQTLDRLADQDITKLSDKAYAWAEKRSWDNMKKEYEKVFEVLVAS